MRILIYSYNYYPEPIGIAPLMTELAEGMVKRGHQVRVITAMPWYPAGEIAAKYKGKLFCNEVINGVKVQRCYIWTSKKRNLLSRIGFEVSFACLSLIQALNGWRPDVILLTVPGLPVCVPAAIVSGIYGSPIVLNLQDILPDAAVHVGLINNQTMIKVLKTLEKFAYKTATKISVIADGFTKNITNKGVALEKIVEIPNWVDINFIKPLVRENNWFRREHQLEDKFVVLYSGNIALTQGLETVIDAAARLQHCPEIALVIVGEPKALAKLQQYCQKHQVNNVRLLPFQPRQKLPDMLAGADVGLVVQKKNVLDFNMPSKIQVLLASGRAIVASVAATGTAASAIRRSGGGIVTAPEDSIALAQAIQELYQDRDRAVRLGQQGRAFAEQNYSFELALDKYEQLFASVIPNRILSLIPKSEV
ncbi:glycosyl transferase group 1 [Stanieria cyanosphaera PCC 7437]|uniref:Glycosyl transferase group 1 n=1 Tax=Stanieria cyanosphaera (strain ATCC 29371 / PCC 7437) TaxID=111780 RepID=K9XVG7_STAC7|nr:glycosyltransferase family 4 protein [Stanieria cyanosphaera]AFZ36585.1 glycosyl transferase group 1 [Stanieria cyanosphaera PCC 7437]